MNRRLGPLTRPAAWRDLWELSYGVLFLLGWAIRGAVRVAVRWAVAWVVWAADSAVRVVVRGPRGLFVSFAAFVGIVVASYGIEMFAEITEFVVEGGEYAWIDGAVLRLVAGARSPALTDVFYVITHVGTTVSLVAVAVVAGGVLAAIARSVVPPLLVLAAIAGMGLTVFTVKLVIARPRPAQELAAYAEDGYGFPSGHAANTTTVYLMLAVLTLIVVRKAWVRALAAALAVSVSVTVGLSRVVLGVHSPTDVVAGWVLGLSWVIIVVSVWGLARNLPETVTFLRELSPSRRSAVPGAMADGRGGVAGPAAAAGDGDAAGEAPGAAVRS